MYPTTRQHAYWLRILTMIAALLGCSPTRAATIQNFDPVDANTIIVLVLQDFRFSETTTFARGRHYREATAFLVIDAILKGKDRWLASPSEFARFLKLMENPNIPSGALYFYLDGISRAVVDGPPPRPDLEEALIRTEVRLLMTPAGRDWEGRLTEFDLPRVIG